MNGNEQYESDLYMEKITNLQKEERKVQYSLSLLNSVQNLINAIGFCSGSLLAVYYVIEGDFTVGDYVLFGTYMTQESDKISQVIFNKLVLFRSIKAGRFQKMLHFDSSHLIVTRGSRVSRAPPHHTLSAFINLNGKSTYLISFGIIRDRT